jgi:hypothetical protein
MTESVFKGMALGDAGFVANLQKKTARRVNAGKPGRPFGKRVTKPSDLP